MTTLRDLVYPEDSGTDVFAERQAFIADATKNVSFQLHYHRCAEKRTFSSNGLTGPDIDNAFVTDPAKDPVRAPGHWDSDELLYEPLTTERVHESCFAMAVNEAVHEALEWLQIDGRPALNPHGTHEDAIFTAVGELVDKLWALRYAQPSHTFCLRVTSTGDDPTHIRAVAPDGLRRRGGRIDGPTLCGADVTRGWDLDGEVTRETVALNNLGEDTDEHAPICRACSDAYLG